MSILQGLTEEHRAWLSKNPGHIIGILSKAAADAIRIEAAREERRKNLLEPAVRLQFPGARSFSLIDFKARLDVRHAGGWIDEWFGSAIESDLPPSEIVGSRIRGGSSDSPYATETEIRENAGIRAAVRLAEVCFFLETADKTPWYCAYVKDSRGILRWVHAEWHAGWYISAVATGYHDELRNGGVLISH